MDGVSRTVTARTGHCAICELIYEDEQGQESDNGGVCDPNGINPAVCCGAHMGCEPKIIEIEYERDSDI